MPRNIEESRIGKGSSGLEIRTKKSLGKCELDVAEVWFVLENYTREFKVVVTDMIDEVLQKCVL